MKKIVIIGGGASGLMAAYTALKNGAKVIIIEKKDRTGTKILATGNGHCNYTNDFFNNECYYGENSNFLEQAFKQFDNKSTVDFFEENGILSRCKNGYIYPYNMEAASVVNMFRTVLSIDKLDIMTETTVESISKSGDKWYILTDKGRITADAVIISCGSNASQKKDLNSQIIKQIIALGHSFIPQKPALTYFKVKEEEIKLASGVRFPVNVKLISEQNIIAEETGELQITSRGISGICIFQLSRFVSKSGKKDFKIAIDFMPDYSREDINSIVYRKINSGIDIEEMFNGILPKKLIIALAKMVDLKIAKPLINQKKQLSEFVLTIKNCILNITGTGDVSESQCLTGGVDVNEIDSSTMESKINKGLYFSGEIIDIDGKCGGYNLQWAWTSGYIAGNNASK